jgi:hypothetical protein
MFEAANITVTFQVYAKIERGGEKEIRDLVARHILGPQCELYREGTGVSTGKFTLRSYPGEITELEPFSTTPKYKDPGEEKKRDDKIF